MSHNLISVHKLCSGNSIIVEFHADSAFVKKAYTKQVLAKGRTRDGLYTLDGQVQAPVTSDKPVDNSSLSIALISIFTAVKPTVWINMLAHPSNSVLNKLL